MDDSHFIEIQRLFEIAAQRGLSELSLSRDGFSISISTVPSSVPVVMHPISEAGYAAPAVPAFVPPPAVAAPAAKAEPAVPSGHQIESPLVGTFYRASSPDADNFVEVGDTVEVGQTVCIVEAMKVFNEITADRAGTVRSVLAKNGQLVQDGQPLVVLDPVY